MTIRSMNWSVATSTSGTPSFRRPASSCWKRRHSRQHEHGQERQAVLDQDAGGHDAQRHARPGQGAPARPELPETRPGRRKSTTAVPARAAECPRARSRTPGPTPRLQTPVQAPIGVTTATITKASAAISLTRASSRCSGPGPRAVRSTLKPHRGLPRSFGGCGRIRAIPQATPKTTSVPTRPRGRRRQLHVIQAGKLDNPESARRSVGGAASLQELELLADELEAVGLIIGKRRQEHRDRQRDPRPPDERLPPAPRGRLSA